MGTRGDGRNADELRPLEFGLDFQYHPVGSVLVRCGGTRVLCAVTVSEGVPSWMRARSVQGGWLTAEYRMLPGATSTRSERESTRRKPAGRSQEIQRLIGRSLRSALDLEQLPALTFNVDCDVVDADGGTRCAAITGASVALELALHRLFSGGRLRTWPLRYRVGAVSVGLVDGEALLDLCYEEDAAASVDMNVVMTGAGEFIEVQGTAEGTAFSKDEMSTMLGLAESGLSSVFEAQKQAIKAGADNGPGDRA